MEGFPARKQESTHFYESKLGRFEIVELKSLRASDVHSGDRAIILTESGNRYMLRHSQSRGGTLLIYNEHEGGFSAATGHPFMIRRGSSVVAEIGKPLEYFAITNEKDGTGNACTSTRVLRIEVRRGLEAAIARHASDDQTRVGFEDISQALRERAAPQRTSPSSDQGAKRNTS